MVLSLHPKVQFPDASRNPFGGVAIARGLGTFIWEPTANLNSQALFDNSGAVISGKMAPYDAL